MIDEGVGAPAEKRQGDAQYADQLAQGMVGDDIAVGWHDQGVLDVSKVRIMRGIMNLDLVGTPKRETPPGNNHPRGKSVAAKNKILGCLLDKKTNEG